MNFNSLSRWIGKHVFFRKLAFSIIRLTTLREWYINRLFKNVLRNKNASFCFLDLGCGLGQHSIAIARKYPHSRVIAIDADGEKIENCRYFAQKEKISNIRYLSIKAQDLGQEMSCDIILCNSVLEHIRDDETVLLTLFNILRAGGYLLIYVPIAEDRLLPHLTRQQHKLLLRDKATFLHEHVRYYSKSELLTKLKRTGFEIDDYEFTYGIYGKLSYDIVTTVQYSPFFKLIFPFYLLFLHPYIMLLMWADYRQQIKTGNGLIIVAHKPNSIGF